MNGRPDSENWYAPGCTQIHTFPIYLALCVVLVKKMNVWFGICHNSEFNQSKGVYWRVTNRFRASLLRHRCYGEAISSVGTHHYLVILLVLLVSLLVSTEFSVYHPAQAPKEFVIAPLYFASVHIMPDLFRHGELYSDRTPCSVRFRFCPLQHIWCALSHCCPCPLCSRGASWLHRFC